MIEVVTGLDATVREYRKIDDEWRRWIAENLLLEMTQDSILQVMVAEGFSSTEASYEIELILRNPCFIATERLRNRLRKRDWLLATYRKLNRLSSGSVEIERRHKLSRIEFLERYYCINRPVIITGMMDDWPAMEKWNLEYFMSRFGDREVEVQVGRNASFDYEIRREKYSRKMVFSEFIEKVRTEGVTNDFYITANNAGVNRGVLSELWDDIVQVPEYLNGNDHNNGFFWFGPAGTITPFHHDLTNNFMAQVIGRKRLKLVPSWDIPLMRNFLHVYCDVDGREVQQMPKPDFGWPQIMECVIHPGEILFLPIGGLHFVEGLDISVTVSFTNFVFDNDFSSFYTTYHNV